MGNFIQTDKGQPIMKRITGLLVAVLALSTAGTTLLAHEETYKGTVISIKSDKVQVSVVDERTTKTSTMEFVVTAKTKVLRGDKVVKFSEARIQKDERIVVTVNHDVSMTNAVVIRLAAIAEPGR
jgi:hypothetical protein